MARIEFVCKEKECSADLVVDIELGQRQCKTVCLNCGEPHIINLHITQEVNAKSTYRNEHWLRDEYLSKGRSMASIAEECAVSPMTIFKWLRTHNIETRKTGRKR